jgi:hypothetical protein
MAEHEQGSAALMQRRELDLLTAQDGIEVRPALFGELPDLVALGRREVAGIGATDDVVLRVFDRNPQSIFGFWQDGRIVGGVAFLYLTEEGLEHLLLDKLNFANPDLRLLARQDEEPAAIYFWALAAKGHCSAGLGGVNAWTRAWPYAQADYYAQPSSSDGERFLARYGFERTPSFQRDLWVYRRLLVSPSPGLQPIVNPSMQHAA